MELDKKLKAQLTASLKLSGSDIEVGVDTDANNPVIWFAVDDPPEVTYVTVPEAKLFIASLETAISQAQDI
jgi:hypothetical protein